MRIVSGIKPTNSAPGQCVLCPDGTRTPQKALNIFVDGYRDHYGFKSFCRTIQIPAPLTTCRLQKTINGSSHLRVWKKPDRLEKVPGNLENVSSYTNKNQAPDMSNLTFSSPDLSSFCQLNNLGLVATGQHLCAKRAVIECRFTKAPEPCPRCGAVGASRGTVDRHLAHTPYGQRPTRLLLRIRRWRCACGCFWHEDTSSAAPPRSNAKSPQSFPMGRYAGHWQPSCWMTCRYPALQTI